MRKSLIAIVVLALAAGGVHAADRVKVGFVSTLSGPQGAPGIDARDGFQLGVKMLGGKLGDLPVEVLVADDQLNPDAGKQIVDRFVKRDRVDFVTGIIYSNVLLAAAPAAFEAKVPFVSSNAGPSQLAGSGCNPWFASAAWQNDASHEASGQYATSKGFRTVYLLAPNYPAGKDALAGFKRFYKGKVVEEVYPRLGQLDFAAELAQVRAAKPDAVYAFMPGGMGINFIKQYVAAGLSKDIQLVLPGFSADEDTIKPVGEPMLGLFNAAHWTPDLDNAESKRFVAAFEKEFGRIPTMYAAQGYDAALMMDGALRAVKGRAEDREALMRALRTGKYRTVRGDYRMNNNGFPIQSYYLRVVGRDAQGRIVNKTIGTIFTNHADAYAKDCKLK
jgi:branched-chain amino acid transport system substrate-binding protein